ncbi:FAD-dependent oxidoreductase [bacterium]|nr:MAG: FAD-dependent oxidoreductase [bacterium]
MNKTTRHSVAIIGGGFTGLTAAYELAKAGCHVTIYEAGNTLGGLAAGFQLADGTPLERAYHFLYTTDNYMIELSQELGVADKLHFYPSSIGAFYRGKLYPFTTAKDLLSFGPLSLLDRFRTGLTGLRLLTLKRWQPLTQITAYQWLCRWNGRRAADLIWKPLLVGKFDKYWDQVTMAWLWTRIHVRQTSKIKGEQSERLGYYEGGFQVVVRQLETELRRLGVTIQTQTQLSAITETNGHPAVVLGGKTKVYDAILAALPSGVLARLASNHPAMTTPYSRQLQDITYLSAVVMVFTTDQPITDRYWHQIHDIDAPFLVFLSLDALVGPANIGGHYVYYIGDYVSADSPLLKLTEDQIKDKWLTGLSKLFPKFSTEWVKESYVFKFANAQHIVGIDYESKIPARRTPLPGVYLSNFCQIFPEDRGTNYAVRDGRVVAAEILHDLA